MCPKKSPYKCYLYVSKTKGVVRKWYMGEIIRRQKLKEEINDATELKLSP